MTLVTAPFDSLSPDPHQLATIAINAWRGRCLSAFARAELAVTETLIALAAADQSICLPHLVGGRFAALAEALTKEANYDTAAIALAEFKKHDRLRIFLCHGHAKVTLERSGRWQAIFTMLALQRGVPERSLLVVEERKASEMATRTIRDSQRLVSCLDRLAGALPANDELLVRPIVVSAAG